MDLTGETTELLQQLIRNACVNDGTPASGGETRSVDTLVSYLAGGGVDVQTYESLPGRRGIVARIEGSDPAAPSLALMGHLDVVPVNADRWQRDPFGGELVGGFVWGRGAIDMLDKTASMAVAFKQLASSGFRPRGALVYYACPDEEALGLYGAKWMTEHHAEVVKTDYLLTEFGGARMPFGGGSGAKFPVMVGEKGTYWSKLRLRGTPGHASMPYRTDNAVVKAAEVVRRLAAYRPPARLHDVWRRWVDGMELPQEVRDIFLDGGKLESWCEEIPVGVARGLWACTHTTIAPTMIQGGVKTNVVPDVAEIQIDVRTLPGERADDTRAMLREAIGEDLWADVEVVEDNPFEASESSMDTPLWNALERATQAIVPGSRTVPYLIVGATDARYFRQLGVVCYGYGLLSERIALNDFMQMFHGDDERIDQESLGMMSDLWQITAREMLAS